MIVIISHHKSKTLSKLLWIHKIPCQYVIIKANPELDKEYDYDEINHTCIVKAPDDYIGLPYKIQKAFQFVYTKFNPDFVFKIDDDMFVDIDKLLSLKMTRDYEGVISFCKGFVYSGGPLYYISKRSLELLQNMEIDLNGEDVSVGKTLTKNGIIMKYTQLYTDHISNNTRHAIAYHDNSRTFLK
jgi:Galactosyltransferase